MVAATANPAMRPRWGWIFAAGVILFLLGLAALGNALSATLVATAIVGLILIVGGVVDIFAALTNSRYEKGGWRLLRGVLGIFYIVVGIEIWADPLKGAIALTVAIGLLLIFEGAVRIFGSLMNGERVLLGIAIGILDVILGLWALTNIPFSGMAIGFFVGLMLLMAGISWMVMAWSLKSGSLP
jgi:uncharacterized membrane protein HdeD (DUF308 family)